MSTRDEQRLDEVVRDHGWIMRRKSVAGDRRRGECTARVTHYRRRRRERAHSRHWRCRRAVGLATQLPATSTFADTAAMSARPASFGLSSAITLPMPAGPRRRSRRSPRRSPRRSRPRSAAAAGSRQHASSSALLHGDQVLALAGLELRDRVAALLDHLVDDREHVGVGQLLALVDLALLDRGQQQADRSTGARCPSRASRSSCPR